MKESNSMDSGGPGFHPQGRDDGAAAMAIGEGRGGFKVCVSGAAGRRWCDHGVGRLGAGATIHADAEVVPYRYPTACARGPSRIAAS